MRSAPLRAAGHLCACVRQAQTRSQLANVLLAAGPTAAEVSEARGLLTSAKALSPLEPRYADELARLDEGVESYNAQHKAEREAEVQRRQQEIEDREAAEADDDDDAFVEQRVY